MGSIPGRGTKIPHAQKETRAEPTVESQHQVGIADLPGFKSPHSLLQEPRLAMHTGLPWQVPVTSTGVNEPVAGGSG